VQVSQSVTSPAALRRFGLAFFVAAALMLTVHTAPASAITRTEVLKRANHWVAKRVPYSQRGYFQGYRRDCSGFVSMSWKLKTSYTSRTISAVAKRIPKSKLRPGDAIHTPGHVAIFGGWANKSHTRYIVLEESGRGKPALKRVKNWRRNATALRYRGIKDAARKVAAKPKPVTVVAASIVMPQTTIAAPLPVTAPFN